MRHAAPKTTALYQAIIPLAGLVLGTASIAAPTYDDPFNQASLSDNYTNDGGGLSRSSGMLDGAAEVSQSRTSSSNLPGTVDGYA